MKLPRDLAGRALIRVLSREFGYHEIHQVGSHIVLETDTPIHHRIPIPDHSPLRIGTLNASYAPSPAPRASTSATSSPSFSSFIFPTGPPPQ